MNSLSATTLDEDAQRQFAEAEAVVLATATAPSDQPLGAAMLGRRALHTTVISTAQYVASQGVRLVGNVLLALLLIPEDFGVMNLLAVFLQGMQMFSDLGIRASIVQSRRGDDSTFLNTLWTIQILRGLGIWLCAIPLGIAAAHIYGNPKLAFYLPVMALTALIEGFQATAVHTADRNLQVSRLAVMQLSTMIIKTVFMVAAACIFQSVWVLVIGAVVHVSLDVMGSHIFLGGIRNRFCWDAESRKTATRFGRWIFIATILTFFAGRGDALILGKVMPLELFGLYSIAYSLAFLLPQATYNLAGRVLFSLYSRLVELDKNHLRARTVKMRRFILAAALPPIWILALVATPLVDLLYRDLYAKTTIDNLNMPLMIQILCVGATARVMYAGIAPIMLATGNSFGHMLMTGSEMLMMIVSMAIGGYYDGARGVLIGLSASQVLCYPLWAYVGSRHDIWFPGMDAIAAVSSTVLLTLAFIFC